MKFKIPMIAMFAVALFAFSGEADADSVQWELDAAHSSVGFSVRHLGISKVRGTFTDVTASVKGDSKTGKIDWVKASIGVASVDTGNKKRDKHLSAADFFDAKKFPKMQITTKKINWKGNNLSGTASMAIKGTTKDVKFKGEYLGAHKVNFGGGDQMRAGYTITAKINRKDFDLSFSGVAEGIALVGDEVTIELEIQIARSI